MISPELLVNLAMKQMELPYDLVIINPGCLSEGIRHVNGFLKILTRVFELLPTYHCIYLLSGSWKMSHKVQEMTKDVAG